MMEAIQQKQRPNRKRKAQEADICQYDESDPKRVKLSTTATTTTTDDQITNNNSNSSSIPDTSKNPFVSFANQPIGFDSLINKNQPSLSVHNSPIKSKSKSVSTSPQKQPKSPAKANNIHTNWSNGNNNGFGSFDNKLNTANSFGWNSNNSNNSNECVWGNSNTNKNEFKFDDSNSQFTLADACGNNNNKNCKNNNKESANDSPKQEIVATLNGVIDAGDNNDKTIISMGCTVYEFDIKNNRYKEKGNGIVKLNTYNMNMNNGNGNGKDKIHARILCRKEVVKKTLINAVFIKETKFDKATEKSVRFTVFEQKEMDKNDDKNEKNDDKNEKNDDKNEKNDKDKVEIVNVTKSYLLKSKENDGTIIDKFLKEIKKIQDKM